MCRAPATQGTNVQYFKASTAVLVLVSLSGKGAGNQGLFSSCLQLHIDGIGDGLGSKDQKHRLLADSFFPLLNHRLVATVHRAHMLSPRQPATHHTHNARDEAFVLWLCPS